MLLAFVVYSIFWISGKIQLMHLCVWVCVCYW